MTNCGAPNCRNRSTDKDNGNRSYHKVPGEDQTDLRKKWLHNIGRKNIPKNIWICSDHFEPSCFKRDLQAELMSTKPRKQLVEQAVPTRFSHIKLPQKRASEARLEERNNQEKKRKMVDEALYDLEITISNSKKDIGCDTQDLATFVEKEVQAVPTTRSLRTQCNSIANLQNENKKKEHIFIKINPPKSKKLKHIAVNTEYSFKPLEDVVMTVKQNHDRDVLFNCEGEEKQILDEEENSSLNEEDSDSDFIPSETSDSEDSDSEVIDVKKTNFIVFWSCILPLLQVCQLCTLPAKIKRVAFKGTLAVVTTICSAGHHFNWRSQPTVNGMAAGNILIAGSILFTGETYSRIRELMNLAKIPIFSHTTFNKIQKKLLFPSIHHFYTTCRQIIFDEVKEKGSVSLLGDGRCDSPGYNAKYGTYTVMNEATNKILDFHVSHVGNTVNSQRMELDGLKNVLGRLEQNGVEVSTLTTDRHKQVRKYMRKEKKCIKHQFDIWHIGRNIKKMLMKFKAKKYAELMPWVKSIINHFWWCCATCNGDANLLKEKWLSILYHIQNKHEWENSKIYKKCCHPPLSKEEASRKPWLKPNSPAFNALRKVVENKSLLGSLKYLTEFKHTGTLEVYHSLYNKYCPKRLHFSYESMIARSQLVALDFNSGNFIHAKDKSGNLRYKQQFSKVTQSWVVKKITEKKDHTYKEYLMDEAFYLQNSNKKHEMPTLVYPKRITQAEKPDKKSAVKHIRSRFKL